MNYLTDVVSDQETSDAFDLLRRGRNRRKSILITGGAGFLGSRLCSRYIREGYRVYCVDNLSTGRMSNIEHLLDHAFFSFIKHDVTEPLRLAGQVSWVYNMACPASPPKYQSDPIHTMKTNVQGALNMLDLALEHGARILQASTSEVYGDPDITPQQECYLGNVNTVGPRSCYDEGKRAAETIFHDYQQFRGADVRIARIFNAYGPGMDPDDGRVVSNFITQALRGTPITVYGDGSQTRSFCFLEDMIDGLMALMHSENRKGAPMCEPVNIGNPDEFTVAELAGLVLAQTGSASDIAFKALPRDDPRRRRPDISLARDRLGWCPKVNLAQGLKSTIPYFAKELARETQAELNIDLVQ
ncbi:UDP-glucuronic acid decarboxylase family protein [Tritonibacter aquimaris]|uniref:UDP-glucuronic acid decarboxylase family protein n=1 Tax=Tritonibacter aquimaris TaxID=2663379 RepID=UPI002E25A073